ncbi:uncharacterized protein A4U43_C04F11690 [Asparagus officinalis]|uniref:SH2 domain-containing protein n=1 Tax=Asparagus officinalis TaxID=4686 RepID=A0A5P1F1X9_ASPOF|nr:uncharacterized protein LOC109837104 [Asparagus officinalis]ONK71723.1 uncharacterized protein A4U43_C04F11690 [Asparagus officinalis]
MTSERDCKVPFLALNEENKLSLFPLMFLHTDTKAQSPDSSSVWMNIPHICTDIDCAREKWVHVGCEVAANRMRLHVNGTLVREKALSVLSKDQNYQDNVKKIALVGNNGDVEKLHAYVYDLRLLPISTSTKDHFIKNPPVKLTLDDSCIADGIEEGSDGVWSIVGGKASCRRNFSLDVVLLDALGRSVHKEMEIFASLVYADNRAPVEKTRDDKEDPLLTSCDGLEFPTVDKPVILLRGRAIFKLKISQLSSKSDNRLFLVRFNATGSQKYPFLEAYSRPIRCISRNRSFRPSVVGRRPFSGSTLPDGTHSPGGNDRPHVSHNNNEGGPFSISSQSESKCSPMPKRFKIGHDNSSAFLDVSEHSKLDDSASNRSVEIKANSLEGRDTALSDSDSTYARKSEARQTVHTGTPILDAIIFRYCLEGIHERTLLLREITHSVSNEDIVNFAEEVCLYAGCSHHRYQILMSKQLIQECTDTWNSISGNSHSVLWTNAIPEINKRFMRISRSATRSLSGKDLEVLRGIAGCGEDLSRENFEKMWYWLYPVAFSLSKSQIHTLWECTMPLWINGLITKEEAEYALKGPRGLQKPGTFVIRFPTSRSWPHPDAGSLVITYVGADSTLHHKLLSLDLSNEDNRQGNPKQLQALLLEEPELSQLARVN